MARGYSCESTRREYSNEYHNGRVYIFFKTICVFVLWVKVALELEWLKHQFRQLLGDFSIHFRERVEVKTKTKNKCLLHRKLGTFSIEIL